MNLTVKILVGMLAGFALGSLLHVFDLPDTNLLQVYVVDGALDVGGQMFIASLRLLVVPLVLVSLVCGASNLSDGTAMGRLGGKAVGLYLFTTAIAVTVALSAAIVVGPGEGMEVRDTASAYDARMAPSLKDVIIGIVPTNPVNAMAEGNMLQIIVFAILLGIAITKAGSAGERVKRLFEDLNDIIMKMIMMLIRLAPYGVFCLMAKLFSDVGWGEIGALGAYFGTVVGVLVIHALVVYPTILVLLGKLSPVMFFRKMRATMLVAFSTSSSGATLPVTLRTVEHRLGVKNEVASFIVPLGATINMDGTAIMQGVATVFIAQYFAIDLGFTDYLMVVVTATLASVGTAGVPGVGLIMLTMVLQQVGLPVEGIMLIIGVDRLLDMMRTAVNVAGDAMVSCVVGKSEGRFDQLVFDDPSAGEVDDDDDTEANSDANSAAKRGVSAPT